MSRSKYMKKQKGFTLVEVVIALTILSLIMLTTLTALRTFADTQEKLQRVTARLDEMRLVTKLLRRTIGQAVPVSRVKQEEAFGSYFFGDESELFWTTPMPGPGLGGLKVLHLAADTNGQLTLQIADYLTAAEEPEWSSLDHHILVEDLDSLLLAYREGPEFDWVEQWELSPASPYSVKMLISAHGRYWPEIVINLNDGKMQRK